MSLYVSRHSSTTIRSHNRAMLLKLLLMHEPISRIELASITGLTIPTVHGLIKELMQENVVEEKLGTTEPQGERRPAERLPF